MKAKPTTLLIVDDFEVNRKLLHVLLEEENYAMVEARNGTEALAFLQAASEPVVGLIDWEMPGLEGIEVCRRARLRDSAPPFFLILLTVRNGRDDVTAGLQAGANDYVTKPFDHGELIARVKIGAQMVALQQALADRARDLEKALADVKVLHGLLPICSYCKRIRNEEDYWQQIESYILAHSEAQFSHGICPGCMEVHLKPQLAEWKAGGELK